MTIDGGRDLAKWGAFTVLVNYNEWPWDGPNADVARANARYVAASNMSVTFGETFKDATASGYEDIFRAAMAYSALEMLEKSLKNHSTSYGDWIDSSPPAALPVNSSVCANDFRTDGCVRLRQALDTHVSSTSLKNELSTLASSGYDVRPLAKGVRHLAFHGVLSPGTIGYGDTGNKAAVMRVLQELRQVLLRSADEQFTTWVEARTV